MSNRSVIKTDRAPAAIGPYSQAIKAGSTVYLSGQIPLDPATMELVGGGMDAQVRRVFDNLSAVCDAAGGALHGQGGDWRARSNPWGAAPTLPPPAHNHRWGGHSTPTVGRGGYPRGGV